MSSTLAQLGFAISSDPLKRLTDDLNKIGPAAATAERATSSLTSTVNQAGAGLTRAAREAAEYEKTLRRASATPFQARDFSDKEIKAAVAGVKEYGSEVDRLRAKLNPLYAASKQYETALNDIAQAEQLGVLTAQGASAARERANLALAKANQQLNLYDKSTRAGVAQTANLAAQFNDIGVMLAAGQSPLQLALQQGTQINQVFSQLGGGRNALRALGAAFVSIINPMSIATIGIIGFGAVAVQWLMSFRNEAESLEDTVDELTASVDRLTDANETSRKSHEDIIRLYGERTAAVMELLDAQKQQATFDAQNAASNLLSLNEFGDVGNVQQATNRRTGIAYQGLSIGAQALQNELRLADEAATRLNQAFSDGQAAQGLEEQLEAVRAIRRILGEGRTETGQWVTGASELYKQFLEAEDAIQRAVASTNNGQGAADDFADGMARVTAEAEALAEEIERAVDAANSFVADGAVSRLRAELANEYRDDPVGLARATAGVEFDRKTDISGLEPVIQAGIGPGIQAAREKYVQDKVIEAEQRLELAEYRRSQRETAKTGGKSDKVSDLERIHESLRLELDLIGKSDTARKAANLARRAGVELSSLEGQAIVEQVILIDRLTDAWDRSQEVIKETGEAQDEAADFFKDTVKDAISDFENLEDVATRALNRIGEALVDNALTDIGSAIASTAFGTAFGSLLANKDGNAFQGGNVIPFARGGIVDSPSFFPLSGGRTGVAGEAGPEGILPLSRGKDGKLGVKAEGSGPTINSTITVYGEASREQKEETARQVIALMEEYGPAIIQNHNIRTG